MSRLCCGCAISAYAQALIFKNKIMIIEIYKVIFFMPIYSKFFKISIAYCNKLNLLDKIFSITP